MSILKKYREIIIYLIVGVLTTIVSWGACFVAKLFLDPTQDLQNFIINTIGWVAGVVFAYPLNRKWVFNSKNKQIMKEFLGFASSRLDYQGIRLGKYQSCWCRYGFHQLLGSKSMYFGSVGYHFELCIQ